MASLIKALISNFFSLISILSFVNPANICHADLKAFFDTVQLNEDKLYSKLAKSALRRLRKYISKEELSDSEPVKESLVIPLNKISELFM